MRIMIVISSMGRFSIIHIITIQRNKPFKSFHSIYYTQFYVLVFTLTYYQLPILSFPFILIIYSFWL